MVLKVSEENTSIAVMDCFNQSAKKMMKKYIAIAFIAATYAQIASGELSPMGETELAAVQGQGLGLVFEDFTFSHGDDPSKGHVFKIGGIKSTQGEDVDITVSQLYISRGSVGASKTGDNTYNFGVDSNYGENLNPVNLGRLNNPYAIDLLDGNTIGISDKAVLQFAAPIKVPFAEGYDCLNPGASSGSGTCSSRPGTADFQGERFDTGLKLGVKVGAKASHNLNINAKSAVIDGSYLRLWADEDMGQPGKTQLVAEYKLNFYTPELTISSCAADGQGCGSTIYMRNFELELALGNSLQPMYLDVNGSGNFVFEVKNIRDSITGTISADGKSGTAHNEFLNYYTNPDFRSNLRIGELSVSGQNFGSAKIEGMLIQYLKIESHDLGN